MVLSAEPETRKRDCAGTDVYISARPMHLPQFPKYRFFLELRQEQRLTINVNRPDSSIVVIVGS